ncbi:MAG: glucosamine-6-phosphate deaminase [Balneolales bacterium]|nr:glucosamine-6-phosphate deaminase [Balneolales bacterium]
MRSVSKYNFDKLEVCVYQDRKHLGAAAAHHVRTLINRLLEEKAEVRIIFAAAASQREFYAELLNIGDIDWSRVVAFHMDEYHTLPVDASQRFGNYLKAVLFRFINLKAIHYMSDNINAYTSLIREAPIDICCLGIGENGHLAFNDPPVADFDDPEVIKIVELDEICRQQQVNDGEFDSIEKVPKTAITLTIPTLLESTFLSVVVPGSTKAQAVQKTIFGEISTACPASILKKHPRAKLFLDTDSAASLKEASV